MEITLAQMDFHTTQNEEECKSKHQTNDVISTPRNEVMVSGNQTYAISAIMPLVHHSDSVWGKTQTADLL